MPQPMIWNAKEYAQYPHEVGSIGRVQHQIDAKSSGRQQRSNDHIVKIEPITFYCDWFNRAWHCMIYAMSHVLHENICERRLIKGFALQIVTKVLIYINQELLVGHTVVPIVQFVADHHVRNGFLQSEQDIHADRISCYWTWHAREIQVPFIAPLAAYFLNDHIVFLQVRIGTRRFWEIFEWTWTHRSQVERQSDNLMNKQEAQERCQHFGEVNQTEADCKILVELPVDS